jgi:hypothetical protein
MIFLQWHPERMVDQNSPFSFNIRQAFINYIIEHQEQSTTETNEEEDSLKEVIAVNE